MSYLLVMTLTGTLLFLGYGILVKLIGRFMSRGLRYRILNIVLLLHVIPLTELKVIYRYLYEKLPVEISGTADRIYMGQAIVSTESGSYMSNRFKLVIVLVTVWIVCTTVKFVKRSVGYIRSRRQLRKIAGMCQECVDVEKVESVRKELRLRRRIDVMQGVGEGSSFTIGMFRPVIVLQGKLSERELEWTLKHEMTHIKRNDVLWKLLLDLVRCIYWFNIFLKPLPGVFDIACETSCDEIVTKDFTKEERNAYAQLVLRSLRGGSGISFSSAFAENERTIQERTDAIMNERKIKRVEKVIAVSLLTVFMLADSLTVLAYPTVHKIESESDETFKTAAVTDGMWFLDEGVEQSEFFKDDIFDVVYDNEFIDENGVIIPVGGEQPQTICPGHHWVNGYAQIHLKNSDGSCIVNVYYATRCTVCGSVKRGDLYSSTSFPKCPHPVVLLSFIN